MKKLLNLVFIAILGVCNLYAQGVDLKREGTTVSSGTDSVCWEGKYDVQKSRIKVRVLSKNAVKDGVADKKARLLEPWQVKGYVNMINNQMMSAMDSIIPLFSKEELNNFIHVGVVPLICNYRINPATGEFVDLYYSINRKVVDCFSNFQMREINKILLRQPLVVDSNLAGGYINASFPMSLVQIKKYSTKFICQSSFAQNSKDSSSFDIPVFLVDGIEVQSLDRISKDDIESVDIVKDPKILKYFYPRMGGLILIKTKSQKQLHTFIQKYNEESEKLKKHSKEKGRIWIR